LLLVMLVGIIEFGRAWNEHQVITDAAREAARKGAIFDESVTEADIKQVAFDAMAAAGINCPPDSVKVFNALGDANTKITVAISLPYQFTFFGPLVKWSTGQSNITLKTAFSMRNE
jgi:Flp pilus assembly protein TadG